jgi:hypothetical protein
MNQTRLYVSAALAVVVMSVGMFMMKADVQVLSTQKDKLMKKQEYKNQNLKVTNF